MALLNCVSVYIFQVNVPHYAADHLSFVLAEHKEGECKTRHWIAYSLRPAIVGTLIEYIWSDESKISWA